MNIARKEDPNDWTEPVIEGYTSNQVSYHIMLLHNAGLIEAVDASSKDGIDWKARNLTWEGHDFLEASENDTVWNKAKQIMKEKGGGMTLDVLKQLLVKLLQQHILS